MEDLTNANMSSALLLLPLELRYLIYEFLLLPQHVHTSGATPNTYTMHRIDKVRPTYMDTRIYLPARLPGNVLRACKQLREESLSFLAHHLDLLPPTSIPDATPSESDPPHQRIARDNAALDESMERHHDSGIVRITLEIHRPSREAGGFYTPPRNTISPHFMALLPLLSRIKKLKLIVWAGYEWWSGISTRPIISISRFRRLKSRRVWSDQTDVQPPPATREQEDEDNASTLPLPPRPNLLATAIDALLHHLPLLEGLHIDIPLHILDFTNWDLPDDIKWEGIRPWLDGPVCASAAGRRLKKVQRRLGVVRPTPPMVSWTFLRQCEVWREGEGVVVERGLRTVSSN